MNYVRSEVENGNSKLDVSSKELFTDSRYLKPTLDDDAVLYNIEELDGAMSNIDDALQPTTTTGRTDLEERIRKLEDTLVELTKRSHESYEAMEEEVGPKSGSEKQETRDREEQQRVAKTLDDGYFQTYSGKG